MSEVQHDRKWFTERWVALDSALLKRRASGDWNFSVPFDLPENFGPRTRKIALDIEQALPLRKIDGAVNERLSIARLANGRLMLSVDDHCRSGVAKILVKPADCVGLLESRRPRPGDHPWVIATRFYTTRQGMMSPRQQYIEPGAAFFVAAIECAGGKTFFCCEGHPNGFYVDFQAPADMTARILACPLIGEPEAVNLAVGPITRISVATKARSWKQRDTALMALADQFMSSLGISGDDVIARLGDPA